MRSFLSEETRLIRAKRRTGLDGVGPTIVSSPTSLDVVLRVLQEHSARGSSYREALHETQNGRGTQLAAIRGSHVNTAGEHSVRYFHYSRHGQHRARCECGSIGKQRREESTMVGAVRGFSIPQHPMMADNDARPHSASQPLVQLSFPSAWSRRISLA